MESIHQDDPLQPLEEREISPEEREQVLKQLETAIVESRTPQRADLALLQAEKRGLLFPLLINLAALVLVGAGVFLLSRHFELRKENITLHRSSYISAEGTLIQTLKQETESRLQAKEEEIASIQRQLQRVDQERQALTLQLEADLETKEEQLRRQLEEDLGRERDRLAALGTSEVQIIEHLRELESREQGSIDRAITDYRRQLDTQLQEKERELLESQRLTREALAQASRERNELLSALRKQESEKSAAEQRLTELNARLQAETLLKDQSAAMFVSLQEHLRAERYSAALQDLESLKDNPIVETYLVDLLKQLIQSSQERAGDEAESAALQAMEAELAAKTAQIDELEEQIRAIVAASSSDKNADAVLAKQLQERADRLSAQLKASEARAERLNAELQTLRAEHAARPAQTDIFEQGRDDALRDVMIFLRFLSGGGDSGSDTEKQLLALARQDPLFRAATREIQILIAGGGSQGELTSPFLFLGIVSSVASERVVIEAMVDLDVSVGSVIQIRRFSDLEREITIAEGSVQQVRGSKITATFKPVAPAGQGPSVRDPVYVVLEGN
jgi:hypothetical protein